LRFKQKKGVKEPAGLKLVESNNDVAQSKFEILK